MSSSAPAFASRGPGSLWALDDDGWGSFLDFVVSQRALNLRNDRLVLHGDA